MARKRNLDEDEVLDRAMDVFWRSGYEGSSMAELTSAMGLSAPSIYGAFHSKRGLFDAVLDRYADRQSEHGVWILSAPTAREVAERMLFRAADELNGKNHPPGCPLIQVSPTAGPRITTSRKIWPSAAVRRSWHCAIDSSARSPKVTFRPTRMRLPWPVSWSPYSPVWAFRLRRVPVAMNCDGSPNAPWRDGRRARPECNAGRRRNRRPHRLIRTRVLVGRGRPREFNEANALNAAMLVFWRQGYAGTSLTDLTDAMGITRPSLYAAFGNKESLFRRALDLYEREKLSYVAEALTAPTARGVAERLLRTALEKQVSGHSPRGCLGVLTAMQLSEETRGIREEVAARSALQTAAIVARFERAKAEGDLPRTAEPLGLARMLLAVVHGLIVQSSLGASPVVNCRPLMDSTLARLAFIVGAY